jgi:excisionase family DNA binding protein
MSDLTHPERPALAMIEPVLIDAIAASEALAISQRTLHSLTKAGAVPHVRLGERVLYPLETLREWARNGCPPVAPANEK